MEHLLKFFIQAGTQWVQEQRDKHRMVARQLHPEERQKLSPYFTPATLDTVALSFVPVIENPTFYAQLQQMGHSIPLDFSTMWGITFFDTIVIATTKVDENSEKWLPILFHECVHVCQYRHLGLQAFMEKYVMGWASNGFQYASIPLEANAYLLQSKFESNSPVFSVEESVVSL
ncbi:MAG: hypothetical protein ABSG48_03060 [Geobacteraceae bacterium]|jgi:hypothetical protein